MPKRTVHSPNSDTTHIPGTWCEVSVTTSKGDRCLWIDLGVYPDSKASTLNLTTSKALRKALKRAERIAVEGTPR